MNMDLTQDVAPRTHLTLEARQRVGLLSLSAIELNECVTNHLQENVFLEHDECDMRKHPLEAETVEMNVRIESLLDRMQRNNVGATDGSYGEIRREFPFEKYLTEPQTLEAYLEDLLAQELRDEADLALGRYLIGNIDAAGYLRVALEEVASRLEVPIERAEHVLQAIQGCTMKGIGARDLEECLLLQLEATGKVDDLTRQTIQVYLPDLAAGRIVQTATALKVEPQDIQRILDLIRSCDPRPGLQFSSGQRQTICPEAVVERNGSVWIVRMQDFDLPQLKLSEEYLKMLDDPQTDQKTARYLSGQLRAAQGLMSGIEQRRMTILQIASCIVARQQGFFDRGIDYLQPLTMAQVATQTGVSESTVSRVVNGKYLQTPQGILEMRYFFHSGLNATAQEGVSSQVVKHRIQNMIAAEDATHPLSDQAIQDGLVGEGIEVSRRTVNKYRVELGIPSRAQRRRHDSSESAQQLS
jgi:RNA polymerase sigma-54 factor